MEELWQGQLDLELTQLDSLTANNSAKSNDAWRRSAKDERAFQRVQTIPGVGRKTAEVLVTALDDVHRFDNAVKFRPTSAWCRGNINRGKRIATAESPNEARVCCGRCCWNVPGSVCIQPLGRATYDRIHGGQKTRKKKAAIALARKIAVVAWSMMRDESEWDSAKLLPDVDPAEVKIKVKRPEIRPAGELHAGKPKQPCSPSRRKKPRSGSRRRAPIKT